MISLKEKNVLLVNAFEDEIEQEGNGKYQLSFKYPTSDQRWKNIELADLLLADDLHGEQEFRVFEIVKRNGYIFVYANQVVDDLNSYSISNISVDRVNGQTAMQALAGSIIRKHPFAFYSDIQDRHIFNQKNISVMDALANGKHSIVGQWGGDLVRDKYNVNLLKRGGRESEALFMYKKNLKSYTETNSIRGLFTRLNLSIKDSDIKTTVDSPLIGSYGGRVYELNIEVADQDVTTLEQLQEYGRNYFAEKLIDVPNNSLTISVTDNQEYDIRIFDMVFVHHEIFDKDLRMKITSYRFSPMGRKLKSVGFGKIKTNLNQQVSNIATEVAEQSMSVAGQVFEKKLQKELKNADKVIDSKIAKAKSEINDGLEQSRADAEAYADTIKQQIDGQLAESDRQYQQAQQAQDRQIAESLRIAGTSANLANAARALAEQSNNDLAQVKASAESQARLILEQAQRQSELINRVTTVENVVDGTKVTVTELSKTLNKATGDIDSVTSRTKTVEDNLSQTRAQYEHLTQTVNAQTGQIDSINRKTVDLQSGIDGVTQRFEKLQIGGNNLLKNTKDFSGEWDYNGQRRKIAPWKYNGLSAIEADYPWEGLTQLIQVRAGEVYTFSAYVASSLASDSAEIYIHLNNYRTEQMAVVDNYYRKFNMTATFQRVSITFKVITDGYIAPRIERSDLNGILYFAGMKLERGTIATDWSPSHKDATNYSDAKIAEYKNTVDGRFAAIQSSVDNKANLVDFQRVQETARLYERIIGTSESEVNTNLARQVLTSSLWQTEITRLPRAGGKNYFLNSNFKAGLQFWENNTSSPDLSIDPQLASQVKRVGALHVDTGNTGAFAHGFYQIVDMPVSANEQVTVSFDVAGFSNNDAGLIVIINNHLFDVRKEIPASEIPKTNSFGPTSLKRKGVTLTIPQDCDRLCCIIIFGPGTVGNMVFADMQIEKGGAASDYRPNPTDANRELEAVTTRVTQLAGAWAVQHLNQAGDILSQANLSSSQFLLEAAKIRLKGKTLADEIQAIDGKFNTLFVADGTFGKLNANVIDSQAITADKLKVDQAFFNKLMANDAYLKQLFAKTAFITSVQAVTMSAGQIVGGVLKATNGAAEFDLNNAKLAFNSSATIEFNSSGNALIRKVGDVTGFLHFNNAAAGGTYVGLGVTSHNEGVKSQDTGRFAGIRIFRSNDTTDQTEIYGDKIYLSHGFNGNGITITATKLSTSYELVDVINSVRALWRCWLHWNGTGWNPDDMAMRRSVINEYNTYNIG
ncbi:TPA: phage tail spike protein [Streptococcus suis]